MAACPWKWRLMVLVHKLGMFRSILKGGIFCFSVFNLCVVLVLFSTVPFLLQSNMESLDTVIQLSVNDLRAQKESTGDVG